MRLIVLALAFVAGLAAAWWFVIRMHPPHADSIVVYYTKSDGQTVAPWTVTLGPARDPKSIAFYAAAQVLAGPPPGTDAVRFPTGTHVLDVTLDGATVDIDLSKDVASSAEGGFTESAEFKALIWTLTDPATLPGVSAVRVRIGGARVATLPGGHLELDEPLSRASF
jgi:spore germination protein GerM